MQMTYAPDEPRLCWKKPEDPKFKPHARIKMAQVLESPMYICGYVAYLKNIALTVCNCLLKLCAKSQSIIAYSNAPNSTVIEGS